MVLGRRSQLRIRSAVRVDWRIAGRCTHHVSIVRDWSRDGAFIQTALPKSPGDRLSLRLDIRGTVIQLEGVVVRRAHDGMGVRLDTSGARFL